ncbi:MAG: hypothetical protein IKI30_00540 [Oxalobacter sp.]|nr:hypothetical protein [Oxalobacter sp.]
MLLKPVYNFFGIAQAQILWDYVIHFNKCRKATADMATKYSMTVFKTAMTDTLFNGNGMEAVGSQNAKSYSCSRLLLGNDAPERWFTISSLA